ncbi:MAG: hypothetical protein PHV68_09175 [Candidatus Gastranaerophilales bacterium]|nr:hypothetical protein [Candidatus Gastranaerophilales bacterium]
MANKIKKVIYKKASSNYGMGNIPPGTIGDVLRYVQNPDTIKLLVNFKEHGKVIIPFSCVEVIE